MKKRRYSRSFRAVTVLSASVAGWCALASPAQAADETADADAVQTLDSVVVLGTHRSNVTDLGSSAPIDVISGEQLVATGAATLNEALFQRLPSFNFPQNQGATRGQDPKGASLRGLSPDQTLVLVNGKRRHASAVVSISSGVPYLGAQPVDLGMIPVSAVETVEILRDGASAQYGSDAVAGVINVILKGRDQGGGLSAQIGQYGQGDGFTKTASGWYGLPLPGEGFVTLSFDALNAKPTDVGDPDIRQTYFDGDPREATADRDKRWGGAARNKFNLGVNAEVGLNERWRLYGFGTYGYDSSENNVIPLLANSDWNVRAIYPDGSIPRYRYKYHDFSATLGLRFQDEAIGDFDVSITHGRDRHHEQAFNTVNPTFGLASPTSFDVGELDNEQTDVVLDYVKDLAVGGLPNPLTVSAGLAYRHEKYEISPGDFYSWGDGGQPILDGPRAGRPAPIGAYQASGIQPLDAGRYTRHVEGAYIGLENQLTDKFQWGLAGRYERYSDFGSARTGKLSLRYDFTPRAALRFTVNNAYRAPTLGQIGTSWTTTTNVSGPGGQNLLTRILPVDDPAARALGADSLTPEKSLNYSLGLVLRPSDTSSITLDTYQIEIRDRVTLSSGISGPLAERILAEAGYPQYSWAQFFINATQTRTRGVDAVARQRLTLSDTGQLELSAGYSYHDTEVTKVDRSAFGFELVGRDQIGFLERGYPRDKLVLAALYQPNDTWSLTLRETRYGSYALYSPSGAAFDREFSPQWTTDLDVKYAFNPKFSVSVGASNLFDSRPERLSLNQRMTPVQRYSFLAPSATEGSFYYLRANYEF